MATDLGQLIFTLTLVDEGFAEQIGAASASMDTLGASGDKAAVGVDAAGASTADAGAAATEASGGFDLFSGSMLKALAPLAALFLGYEGIKSIIASAKTENDLYNNSVAQITNTLKQTHDAIGLTLPQLEKMASTTSKGTAITDASNLAAEQQLLNYKLTKPVFDQATASIDNIATSMANARGVAVPSSEDITMAAKKLGLALQDPTTGVNQLARAGIKLTAEQQDQVKALQKSGDTLGAQTLLMQDFANATQGKAAASLDTFQGKVEYAKKALDEDLRPILQQGQKDLENLANTIMNGAIKAYDFLKPAIDNVMNAFKSIMVVVDAHKKGLEDLLKVIGGTLIVALYVAINAFAILIHTIADLINWASSAIHFITSLTLSISEIGITIVRTVSNFGSLLYGAGRDLVQGLIKGIEDAAGAAVNAVKKVGSDIVNAAKSVLKVFSPSQVFADIGANVVLGMAQGISDNADTAVQATNQMATGVVSAGSVNPISSNSNQQITYNFGQGSVVLSTAEAVDEFFNIGNRSTALELAGGSPLAGTTGV